MVKKEVVKSNVLTRITRFRLDCHYVPNKLQMIALNGTCYDLLGLTLFVFALWIVGRGRDARCKGMIIDARFFGNRLVCGRDVEFRGEVRIGMIKNMEYWGKDDTISHVS